MPRLTALHHPRPEVREELRELLGALGCEVETGTRSGAARTPELVIGDPESALAFLLKRPVDSATAVVALHEPEAPPELLTELEERAEALAFRPFSGPAGLEAILQRALVRRARDLADERRRATVQRRFERFAGGPSVAAQRLRDELSRLSGTPRSTLLLMAARGLPVELVAEAIHGSAGSGKPFLEIDVASWARSTTSDALSAALARARGGTLFLREVSALTAELQAELAERLEGRGRSHLCDLRLIASTRHDLEQRVETGRFRDDLFYRLNVLTLRVPTISQRREDLPRMIEVALHSMGARLGRMPALSPAALDTLQEHTWPGNQLELEAVMMQAALNADCGLIEAEHLGLERPLVSPDREPVEKRSLRDREADWIRRVLAEESGNRSRAARVLGINRATLYNKLRQYEIV